MRWPDGTERHTTSMALTVAVLFERRDDGGQRPPLVYWFLFLQSRTPLTYDVTYNDRRWATRWAGDPVFKLRP